MEHLYTILAEFRGSTHISQIEADTPAVAVQRWSERESLGKQGFPAGARSEVRKQLSAGDLPVPVSGHKNVWCISGTRRDDLILIHVVLTCSP